MLHMAAKKGFTDVANYLIEAEINLDKQDTSGRYIFFFQHIIILFQWNHNFRTALFLAIQNGYTDLAEKLIESSANLDLQDSNGRYS